MCNFIKGDFNRADEQVLQHLNGGYITLKVRIIGI